jgi:hypothetical protein
VTRPRRRFRRYIDRIDLFRLASIGCDRLSGRPTCSDRGVGRISSPPAPISAVLLGAGFGGPNPGAHSRLSAQTTEESEFGLFQNVELGVVFVDTELVQGGILRLFD